jgi:hypothetical protein
VPVALRVRRHDPARLVDVAVRPRADAVKELIVLLE